ncbi:MAG: hypothetical protein M3N98_12275 [Actinomycetota bacterium]|nr:hypothetical protein [Actinomycetota bacterium]
MRLAAFLSGVRFHGFHRPGAIGVLQRRETSRGHITKAGNWHMRTQLIESAWAYQSGPSVGVELRKRQEGVDADTLKRAWAAQTRLCGRFRRLAARKNSKNVVAAAIARELCGFLWAEMTA